MKKYLILLTALTAVACNSGQKITTTQKLEYTTDILEYTPAPGQFINEPKSGYNNVTTPEAACRYASERLAKGDYVSLGGWGGYIVARFAKPVPTANGHELFIAGNPLPSSSEPGVVWVMQDANGNGRADELWYALRGSEYARSTRDYRITYLCPDTDNTPIAWHDNKGGSGTIDRMTEHTQPSYFPAWIPVDELSFEAGVRLPDNISQGPVEGEDAWLAQAFAWGYVDNYSASDMARGHNRLSISDAVDAAGEPAQLTQIDFVKIQTGVNAQAPRIGEMSTEVCRIACMRTGTN